MRERIKRGKRGRVKKLTMNDRQRESLIRIILQRGQEIREKISNLGVAWSVKKQKQKKKETRKKGKTHFTLNRLVHIFRQTDRHQITPVVYVAANDEHK